MDDGSFHAQMEILQQKRQSAAHTTFRRDGSHSNDRQARVRRLRERLHPRNIGMTSPSASLTSSSFGSNPEAEGVKPGFLAKGSPNHHGSGKDEEQAGAFQTKGMSTPSSGRTAAAADSSEAQESFAPQTPGFAPGTPGRSPSMSGTSVETVHGGGFTPEGATSSGPRGPGKGKILEWAIQGAEEDQEAVGLKKKLLAQRNSAARTGGLADGDAHGEESEGGFGGTLFAEGYGESSPSGLGPATPAGQKKAPWETREGHGETLEGHGDSGGKLGRGQAKFSRSESFDTAALGLEGAATPAPEEKNAMRRSWDSLSPQDWNGSATKDSGLQFRSRYAGLSLAEDDEDGVEATGETEGMGLELQEDSSFAWGLQHDVQAAGGDEGEGLGSQADGTRAAMSPNGEPEAYREDGFDESFEYKEEVGENGEGGAVEEQEAEEDEEAEGAGGADLEVTPSDVYYGRGWGAGASWGDGHGDLVSESDADTAAMPAWKISPLLGQHWGPSPASESEASECPRPAYEASAVKSMRRHGAVRKAADGGIADAAMETKLEPAPRPIWGGLHLESDTEAEDETRELPQGGGVSGRGGSFPDAELVEHGPNPGQVKGMSLSLAESEDEGDFEGRHGALVRMSSLSGRPGDLSHAGTPADVDRATHELDRKWDELEQKWATGRAQMRRAARMAAALKSAVGKSDQKSLAAMTSDSEASVGPEIAGAGHRRSHSTTSYASTEAPPSLHSGLRTLVYQGSVGDDTESETGSGAALSSVHRGYATQNWRMGAESPDATLVSSRASLSGGGLSKEPSAMREHAAVSRMEEELEALKAAREAWEQRAKAAETEARSLRRQTEQQEEMARTKEASLRAELELLRTACERTRRRQIEERGKWRRAAFQLRAALGMMLPEIKEEDEVGLGSSTALSAPATAAMQQGIFSALTTLIEAESGDSSELPEGDSPGVPTASRSLVPHSAGGASLHAFGGRRLLLEHSPEPTQNDLPLPSPGNAPGTPSCKVEDVTAHGPEVQGTMHGRAAPAMPSAAPELPKVGAVKHTETGNADDTPSAMSQGSARRAELAAPGPAPGTPRLPVRRGGTPSPSAGVGGRGHAGQGARPSNIILRRLIGTPDGEARAEMEGEGSSAPAGSVGPPAGLGEALQELRELEQKQAQLGGGAASPLHPQATGPSADVAEGGAAPGSIAADDAGSASKPRSGALQVIWRSGRDSAKNMVVKSLAKPQEDSASTPTTAGAAVKPTAKGKPMAASPPPPETVGADTGARNSAAGGGQKPEAGGEPGARQSAPGTPHGSAIFGVVKKDKSRENGEAAGAPAARRARAEEPQRSAKAGVSGKGEDEGVGSLRHSGESFEFAALGGGTARQLFEFAGNGGHKNGGYGPIKIADPVSDGEEYRWLDQEQDLAVEVEESRGHAARYDWAVKGDVKRSATWAPFGGVPSTKAADVDQEKLLSTLEKWMLQQRKQALSGVANVDDLEDSLDSQEFSSNTGSAANGHGQMNGGLTGSEHDPFEDGSLESRLFQKVLARQRGLANIKPYTPKTPSKAQQNGTAGGIGEKELQGGTGAGLSPQPYSLTPQKGPKVPSAAEMVSPSKWKPIPPLMLTGKHADVAGQEMHESSSGKWRLGGKAANAGPTADHSTTTKDESDNDSSFVEPKRASGRHVSRSPARPRTPSRGGSAPRRAFGMSPGRAPSPSGRRNPARGYPTLGSYQRAGNLTPPRSFPRASSGAGGSSPSPYEHACPDCADHAPEPTSPVSTSQAGPTVATGLFGGLISGLEAASPQESSKTSTGESGAARGGGGGLLKKIASFGLVKRKKAGAA